MIKLKINIKMIFNLYDKLLLLFFNTLIKNIKYLIIEINLKIDLYI